MEPKAVLFDMDGVVVDSEAHWIEREEALFAELLGPGVVDVEGEIAGMQYEEIYDLLVAEYGLEMEREAFLAEYEDAAETVYGEQATLMPGFEGVVAALREAGVTVALVSAAPHDWIDLVVARFGLEDAFAVRVSADDVDGPSKPDPGIYALAAENVGVDPEHCVAVEDSLHGVESARRAGATAVAYRTGHNQAFDFDAAGADVVVDGPDGLREYLSQVTRTVRESESGRSG